MSKRTKHMSNPKKASDIKLLSRPSNVPVLALACDAAYAMPLATALRSIVEANRGNWPLEVHLLTDGFLEETRRKVCQSLPKGSASINWFPVDLYFFKEFTRLSHISPMTYARLLIPQILPQTLSRVLFLDADVLVLEDLGPLWEWDLHGAVVGAVLDRWAPQIKRREAGLEDLPRVQDYFNAGVLLIDLKQWRDERISDKAMEYLTKHPRAPFSDQDALNAVCDGRWARLDPRWNFQDHDTTRLSEVAPEQRPSIIHFLSRDKPWKPEVMNVNASFYNRYRSRTCFAQTFWQSMQEFHTRTCVQTKQAMKRHAIFRALYHIAKS